jgi:hypothetical protein
MSATDEKEHDEYVALLEQENATLLAALENLFEFWNNGTAVYPETFVVAEARAAIAQAKGE